MRVYVPLTLPALAEVHRSGELGPAPLRAYAVTPALREWLGSDDIEELEYAALGRAALASLQLLAEDPAAARRRVVLAVDVADRSVTPEPASDEASLGRVAVAGDVRLTAAGAVHADADDAGPDVSAAAAAVPAAAGGDAKAQDTVDAAEDHELLWYGVQEIPNLIGG
ncbi:hypothetical protein LG634_32010 [Streptomyces bambusae]|uniref:DUF6912 family protein n=1 Tax=Streptomyces bambusae TaxID=1550616 RepID=UPI001CFFE894|nr:hypothetical protein [Streptomyces bambusae]MCB5169422.1 hypothetical protein [Streptomyces bambusae]